MKSINLFNIKTNFNFYLINLNHTKKRWGRFDNTSILFYIYKKFAILNIFNIYISLKKIIWITFNIAYNQGICLTFFDNKFLLNFYLDEYNYEKKILNFYILRMHKIFGFISSFWFFIPRIADLKLKKLTNYSRERPPSLVFFTKKCWKIYFGFLKIFTQLRILSIKSSALFDVEIIPNYNIFVNDCILIFKVLKYIYKINNKFVQKW